MYRTSNLEFKSPHLIKRQNSSSNSSIKPFKRKSSVFKYANNDKK